MSMLKLLFVFLIGVLSAGCVVDVVADDNVSVVYRDGGYGYYYGGSWYAAPPGYVYIGGRVNWGPHSRGGYGHDYRQPNYRHSSPRYVGPPGVRSAPPRAIGPGPGRSRIVLPPSRPGGFRGGGRGHR